MRNKTWIVLFGIIIIALVAYVLLKPKTEVTPVSTETSTTATQNGEAAKTKTSTKTSTTTASPAALLPTPYITEGSGWPPSFSYSLTDYLCNPEKSELSTTVQKKIGTKTYCVTDTRGSTPELYEHIYTYVTADSSGRGIRTSRFELTFQDCDMYTGGPQQTECRTKQSAFNLDTIVNNINK
jgi:hypothetical protein